MTTKKKPLLPSVCGIEHAGFGAITGDVFFLLILKQAVSK